MKKVYLLMRARSALESSSSYRDVSPTSCRSENLAAFLALRQSSIISSSERSGEPPPPVPVAVRLRVWIGEVLACDGVELGLSLRNPHQSTLPVMVKYRSELYASTRPRFLLGALPRTMMCTPVPDGEASA